MKKLTDLEVALKLEEIEREEETLEEVAERLLRESTAYQTDGYSEYQNGRFNGIIEGAEWQQERMYSEEDLKSAFKVGFSFGYRSNVQAIDRKNGTCEEWFKKFKNKN